MHIGLDYVDIAARSSARVYNQNYYSGDFKPLYVPDKSRNR